MFIEFKDLPTDARVWLYQAEKNLTVEEEVRVLNFLTSAVETWVTHGMPMKGSVKILFHRLIVIAADTGFQQPSGCSIDASTDWLQELGKETGINFFDRSIGYFEDEHLRFFSVFEAKKQVTAGLVQPHTRVINLQAATVHELENALIVPASESFLNRYFPLAETR